MTHIIKTGAALLVLGGFAVATPALAVSPFSAIDTVPLIIPVQDEENAEVWHDLRPDVTPPEAAVGNEEEVAPKDAAPEQPKGQGSGNIEQKELEEDGVIPQ
ncbi:MAG: hypothetical protein ACRD9W_30290 [Terriglobia bacterium]